jgi:hypothetical protein
MAKNDLNLPRNSASEEQLHLAVAEYLGWCLLPPALFSTFPAGYGKLGKATAGRLRAAGLAPGMPDLMVFHRGCAIGIELKAPGGGHLTAVQRTMHERLRAAGVPVYTCRSLDEVIAALEREGVPLRSSSAWPRTNASRASGRSSSDSPSPTSPIPMGTTEASDRLPDLSGWAPPLGSAPRD